MSFFTERTTVRRVVRGTCLALAAALAGCTSYTKLPLVPAAPLVTSVAALENAGRPLPANLGIEDVARLAVLNDPALRALRAQQGIANASILQAGLLPDPQYSLDAAALLAGPATQTSYAVGMVENIQALILMGVNKRIAKAGADQVTAQILWQEWLVIGQARVLSVQLIEQQRILSYQQDLEHLLHRQLDDADRALAANNTTTTQIAPILSAVQGVRTQINSTQRTILMQHQQLAALLGLVPDAAIPLAGTTNIRPVTDADIRLGLQQMTRTRPDLVALQLGYRMQDAKFREAILAQFPALSFGPAGGSDNTNVHSLGPQVNFTLPIFNRNKGNVASQKATRQQLHDDYTARLMAATGDIEARFAQTQQIEAQLDRVEQSLPPLISAEASARQATAHGFLGAQSYVDLATARLNRESERVSLEQMLLEQRIALITLLGAGMPALTIPADRISL